MVMRPLGREPARLDSLDLFRQLDVGMGRLSDPQRIEAFLGTVRAGLGDALSRESTVHGWRTQALFASLVVALDGCELMFSVDHGEVFVDGEDVKPPDVLLVLRDGRRFLVDVKSVPPKKPTGPLVISAREMAGLRRFADLVGADLFIAGLFSALGEWVLVPAAAFDVDAVGRYNIDLLRAMQTSHMNDLGDVMLGVRPPIRLDLIPDTAGGIPMVAADGTAEFKVGTVELRVGDEVMVTDEEVRLASFMLFFNNWNVEQVSDVQDNGLRRLSWVREPEERTPGQGFEIVGRLSSMYTQWFLSATTDDAGVSAIQAPIEPGVLPSLLPADFSSPRLPLWRFRLVPDAGDD